MKVFIHGTDHSKRRCTDGPGGTACDICTAASRRYQQKRREKLHAILQANPASVQHGTANTYQNYGCRCDECRVAGYTIRRKYAPYHNKPPRPKPFGREWVNGNTGT